MSAWWYSRCFTYPESLGGELYGEGLLLLGDEVEVDIAAGAGQHLRHAHQLHVGHTLANTLLGFS